MPTFIRCVENLGGGKSQVHARDALGDGRTLCGYAYEGNPGEAGENGVVEAERGTVECKTCLRIIRYCKRIPSTALATTVNG